MIGSRRDDGDGDKYPTWTEAVAAASSIAERFRSYRAGRTKCLAVRLSPNSAATCLAVRSVRHLPSPELEKLVCKA